MYTYIEFLWMHLPLIHITITHTHTHTVYIYTYCMCAAPYALSGFSHCCQIAENSAIFLRWTLIAELL